MAAHLSRSLVQLKTDLQLPPVRWGSWRRAAMACTCTQLISMHFSALYMLILNLRSWAAQFRLRQCCACREEAPGGAWRCRNDLHAIRIEIASTRQVPGDSAVLNPRMLSAQGPAGGLAAQTPLRGYAQAHKRGVR